MADADDHSWDDGRNYRPQSGPPEPIVPVPGSAPPPPPTPSDAAAGWQQTPRNNSQSVGALTTGILSLVFLVFCGLLSLPLGIAAITLGVKGRRQAQSAGAGTGMATTGMLMGAFSLVALVVGTIVLFVLGSGAES
jgi:hypothetical protein